MERVLERFKIHRKILFNVLVVVWGSCLLTASGALSLQLPFTPVPIAMNHAVVVLLGIMMGPKRGAAAALLWLAEGALGLPVFSQCRGGLLCLIGPSGGYLLSYPLAPIISGLIAYRKETGLRLSLAFLFGSLSTYPGGLFHLASFVGGSRVLAIGFIPFLLGDFIKAITLTVIWKKVRPKFLTDA